MASARCKVHTHIAFRQSDQTAAPVEVLPYVTAAGIKFRLSKEPTSVRRDVNGGVFLGFKSVLANSAAFTRA